MPSIRHPNLMYPTDDNFEVNVPPEVSNFRSDFESLGVVNDLDNWYVTGQWAEKFEAHFNDLLPLAEQGHVLAQYSLAIIHMMGLRYSSIELAKANYSQDISQMSQWLELAAKQGYMGAIDILGAMGVGEEAERLRGIIVEIFQEKENGATFPLGETWRRAYGT